MKTRKIKGGDFGLSAVVVACIPLFVDINPLITTVVTFLGTVTTDKEILSEGSIMFVGTMTLLYNIYNQGGVKWMISTPLMSGTAEILQGDYLIDDLKKMYSYSLLTAIDISFLYDKHVITTIPPLVPESITVSTNLNTFDKASIFIDNSIIILLLDLWIFTLYDVIGDHTIPTPTDGLTSNTVEARAVATWSKVCQEYRNRLGKIKNQGPYARVFDYLNIVLFTPEMPEFIKNMLEHTNLYASYKFGNSSPFLHPVLPYNYSIIIKSLENIRKMVSHDTTLRIDNLHLFLRDIVRDPRFVDFDIVTPSTSFHSFIWNLLQTILSSVEKLKEFEDFRIKHGINRTDLIFLTKNLNILYSRLYITKFSIANRVTRPGLLETSNMYHRLSSSLGRLKNRFFGGTLGNMSEKEIDAANTKLENQVDTAGNIMMTTIDLVLDSFENLDREKLALLIKNSPILNETMEDTFFDVMSDDKTNEMNVVLTGLVEFEGDKFYDPVNGGKKTKKRRIKTLQRV